MTYDAADGYVLWYGGGCEYGCNQTAAFQNGTWRNIPTPVSPTAEEYAPIAYDAADGYVVLQGGTGYNCFAYPGDEYSCNETWEYKAGVWTQLHPRCYYLGMGYGNCSLPAGYRPMVYDAATGSVFLDGGYQGGPSVVSPNGDYGPWVYKNDTWTFLGYNFSSGRTISNPNSKSLVYDAADGHVMAFGGPSSSPSLTGNFGDNYTWEWENDTWTNISANVTNAPPGRYSTSMAYDATDGYVLLYGGTTVICTYNWSLSNCGGAEVETGYADTWKYQGGNWTELNASSAPGYTPTPLLAYDPIDRGVVDFNDFSCGDANFTSSCTCPCGVDSTWLWGPAAPIGNVSIEARNAVDAGVSMNLSVTFDGGTAPFTIQWAFGDGQFAVGRSVKHAYSAAGNFTAYVWINDSQGYHAVGSIQVAVYAGTIAAAYAFPNPTDVSIGTTLFPGILDGSPPQYSFKWSFGDGGTASYFCQNPCGPAQAGIFHAYSTSGTYTAQVSVTYPNGAVINESLTIRVNPNLVVSGIFATPNPAVLGQPVNFTSIVTGGTPPYTYSWSFGDGGTGGNLSVITHVYETDGPFEAMLLVADAAGSALNSTLSLAISLNTTVSGNASVGAAPLLVAFSSVVTGGVPGYTYQWEFGDGTTNSSPDPIHSYSSSGEYTARLGVRDSVGHSETSYWMVQVFPGGRALTLAIDASATNLTVGETTTLSLSPSGGVGAYALTWIAVPTGCIPVSSLLMNCSPAANGSYSASAKVTDSHGSTATAEVSFTVGKAATPTHEVGGGNGFLGLADNEGLFLLLGLAGGALVGVVSMAVVTRQSASLASGPSTPTSESSPAKLQAGRQSREPEETPDPLKDLF
ncbi:MAG: PKD domain-containing protein [Thermoplasmata archaeon]